MLGNEAQPTSVWFLAPVAVVSGLVALISGQVSKRYGLAVDGDQGFLRQGFIGQVITVFPMYKVQRVDIRQTPLQERSGRAHLTVHLASHSLSLPYVPLETAQRFRDLALYRAETTRKRWY